MITNNFIIEFEFFNKEKRKESIMMDDLDIIGTMMSLFVISLIAAVGSGFRMAMDDEKSRVAEIVFAIATTYICIYLFHTFYNRLQSL